MLDLSVIICSHNPRTEYLERTISSLRQQTLDKSRWELLLVDNNSDDVLATRWDLSWHPHARHVREQQPGLTPARIRGIAESRGGLLIFVDDDNVLAPDYLKVANDIRKRQPVLGAFGSGALEPEFERAPPVQLRPWLSMLALRTVSSPQFADKWSEKYCIPWGAGLCVTRAVAQSYAALVTHMNVSLLDRCGDRLFCGGDDLFSFVAAGAGRTFGIYPELGIRHLISSSRLNEQYFLRLIHDHACSHAILNFRLTGDLSSIRPVRDRVRALLHGLRRGRFAMLCRLAELRGVATASQLIRAHAWTPIEPSQLRSRDAIRTATNTNTAVWSQQ